MEIICLCCLAETSLTYKITTKCELGAGERYETNQPIKMVELGELYSQLTQLPPTLEIPSRASQLICEYICARCVGMLKDFCLFRMTVLKTREELQTKANIARIINSLEQSIDASVVAEHLEKDLGHIMSDNGVESSEVASNNDNVKMSCIKCFKKFKSNKLLKRHIEIHSSEKNYHCRFCEKAFAAKASYYNHEMRVHRKLLNPKEEKVIVGENFISKIHIRKCMANHKSKQQKQNIFQCDDCTKSFTRKSSLNNHKLVLHAGVRQHSCVICNRTFGKEDSLNTHMALHDGKKFRCKLCSKSFAKSSFLRKHLEEHEMPDSKRKFTCAACSKQFTALSHLNDHVLIHSDRRPHICNHCGRSFRQKQQLKVHTYQHVGKPFRCANCNLSYTSRSRLQKHVDKQHPNPEEVQFVNKSNLTIAVGTGNLLQPDFGDKAVNEEILNEICSQINLNPIILENIEAGGVNLIYNENIVFLNE